MDVCLTNYGHCNYVSGKHACIFYDEVRGGRELCQPEASPSTGVLFSALGEGMRWGPLLLFPPWHSRKRRALVWRASVLGSRALISPEVGQKVQGGTRHPKAGRGDQHGSNQVLQGVSLWVSSLSSSRASECHFTRSPC